MSDKTKAEITLIVRVAEGINGMATPIKPKYIFSAITNQYDNALYQMVTLKADLKQKNKDGKSAWDLLKETNLPHYYDLSARTQAQSNSSRLFKNYDADSKRTIYLYLFNLAAILDSTNYHDKPKSLNEYIFDKLDDINIRDKFSVKSYDLLLAEIKFIKNGLSDEGIIQFLDKKIKTIEKMQGLKKHGAFIKAPSEEDPYEPFQI